MSELPNEKLAKFSNSQSYMSRSPRCCCCLARNEIQLSKFASYSSPRVYWTFLTAPMPRVILLFYLCTVPCPRRYLAYATLICTFYYYYRCKPLILSSFRDMVVSNFLCRNASCFNMFCTITFHHLLVTLFDCC